LEVLRAGKHGGRQDERDAAVLRRAARHSGRKHPHRAGAPARHQGLEFAHIQAYEIHRQQQCRGGVSGVA